MTIYGHSPPPSIDSAIQGDLASLLKKQEIQQASTKASKQSARSTMAIENRGPELQAVAYILVSFSLITTILRCYVRIFKVKVFGIDDWSMVFGMIAYAIYVSFVLAGVHYGTGRHYWDLEPANMQLAFKQWWFCYLFYCLTMIPTKISIGYFLLRIPNRRIDVYIIYAVMVITIITGIVFFFLTLFQCTPISFFWNKDQEGWCISMDIIIIFTYLYSACSVICDFTFALLPIAIVWKLKMSIRSKLILVPILAMACVASAAVLIRFPYVKDFKNPDFLYATTDIAIWSTAEGGLGITAGNLATLRPLVQSMGGCFGFTQSGQTELTDMEISNRPRPADPGKPLSRSRASLRKVFRPASPPKRPDSEWGLGMDSPTQRASHEGQDGFKLSTMAHGGDGSGHGSEDELRPQNDMSHQDWRNKKQGIMKMQTITVTEERA